MRVGFGKMLLVLTEILIAVVFDELLAVGRIEFVLTLEVREGNAGVREFALLNV